jgi:hypothetical protein
MSPSSLHTKLGQLMSSLIRSKDYTSLAHCPLKILLLSSPAFWTLQLISAFGLKHHPCAICQRASGSSSGVLQPALPSFG